MANWSAESQPIRVLEASQSECWKPANRSAESQPIGSRKAKTAHPPQFPFHNPYSTTLHSGHPDSTTFHLRRAHGPQSLNEFVINDEASAKTTASIISSLLSDGPTPGMSSQG